MLEGNFFKSTDFRVVDGVVSGSIVFDRAHSIFEGHFPGQPVVPGVCMLQIIKELLEKAVSTQLMLRNASQVKYLALIDPVQFPEIEVEVNFKAEEGNQFSAAARLFKAELNFLKFKGRFEVKSEKLKVKS